CQDNETGWVDWNGLARNRDIFEYTKALIVFRKSHNILHSSESLTMLDRYGYGYPELSYHGEEAWKAQLDNYNNRHIGIMYCGKKDKNSDADYIYIAYNMHWNSHRFALPSIANHAWVSQLGTEVNHVVFDEEKNMEYIDISPRSVTVLTGRTLSEEEKKRKASLQIKAIVPDKKRGVSTAVRKDNSAYNKRGSKKR
ncbi:MAG: hypothetical protein K2M91_06240, partial [Lachnospiraceae bacterium]|nr:hypothetical protein [Lachnospiraceae bacterium]